MSYKEIYRVDASVDVARYIPAAFSKTIPFFAQHEDLWIGKRPDGREELIFLLSGLRPHHVLGFLETGAWGHKIWGEWHGDRVEAERHVNTYKFQQKLIDRMHQEANLLGPDVIVPIGNSSDVVCFICGMNNKGVYFDKRAIINKQFSCDPVGVKIAETDEGAMRTMNYYFHGDPMIAKDMKTVSK